MYKKIRIKQLLSTLLVLCLMLGLMPMGYSALNMSPVGALSEILFKAKNTIEIAGMPNVSRLEQGEMMETSVTAKTTSGEILPSNLLSITYEPDNHELVTVDANGVLKASESNIGMTTVRIIVTYKGSSLKGELLVCVLGKNLIRDGSFEEDNTFAKSWDTQRGMNMSAFSNIIRNEVKVGKSAYAVQCNPGYTNQKAMVKLNGESLIPIEAGKFYELSAWVKVSDFADGVDIKGKSVKNKASIEVEYYRTNSDVCVPVANSRRSFDIMGNMADWTYVRVPVAAPLGDGAKYATVRIVTGIGSAEVKGIGGKFLYDGLSFHEVTVDHVSLVMDDTSGLISVGNTMQVKANVLLSNNDLLAVADESAIRYTSSDPQVLSIDKTGKFTAKAVGNATIKAMVHLNGKTYEATKDMRILKDILNAVYGFGNVRGIKVGESKQINVTGRMMSGKTADVSKAKITYSSDNPKAVSVSNKGVVKALTSGHSDISVEVTLDGVIRKTNLSVVVGDQKTTSTIYTTSKVAAARENVKQYDWAKKEMQTAVDFANKIVDSPDLVWNAVASQKVPRGITVGFIYDPDAWTCTYCGTDLRAKHGSYPYYMDPINKPWKIQCPECKRWFPSNDFDSYYKSGLNKQGEFVPELANKKLLKNELYPEKGEGWGVDDGYGYVTGKIQPNGVREVKTWVAYYNHWGLWHKTADKSENTSLIRTGLNSLRDAYLFTGDIRYGRTGAILIDRIADLYPDFKLMPYKDFYNSHGLGFEGKIIGRIWETGLATDLARAYDAFYPIMEDKQVISYLSEKAKTHELINPKTNASMIRENCENGILRNIYDEVQNANIYGNFGMHQTSLATAAVALDTMPDTKNMIDFTFKAGEYVWWENPTRCSGGNVLAQLVDKVDRDGHGNESAPGYNVLWLNQMVSIADALDGYTGYDGADLYKNPKFLQMFSAMYPLYLCTRYTAQIGDSGSTANAGFIGSLENTTLGFMKSGDQELAQAAYLINKNSTAGIHASIFTKNPEKVAQDIEAVIQKQGPFNLPPNMLAGYGFAALRDGKLTEKDDTQRDFWMHFGRTQAHGHIDAANLGIHAYGLDMAPDLGYPEATGVTPNRMQWVRNTISHNTVVVNSRGQDEAYDGTPLHFDNSGDVQVMDIAYDKAYRIADTYRRSIVMVRVDDSISYGVDFFRVKGGNDHLYSFHAQSDEIAETEGLNLSSQVTGTYAGTGVEWGPGAETGFSWLENVSRAMKPNTYSIDFKIKDFRSVLPQPQDLHLRMTMLNASLNDVAIADGTPPRVKGNIESPLKYVLAHRSGKDLDTMFTTVFEPYKDHSYIKSIEEVKIKAIAGKENPSDISRAVKVTLTNGRVDYVMHATNNSVTYRVDDQFDFRGAFGVYRAGFAYLLDGDIIGEHNNDSAAYTGKILDFTKGLLMKNSITVSFNGKVDITKLSGKYIFIDNDGVQNAIYQIKAAKANGNDVTLDLGTTTVIRKYIDPSHLDQGFIYNIGKGQSFRIPTANIFGEKQK